MGQHQATTTTRRMEALTVDGCLALLQRQALGRVAFVLPDGSPSIQPVNYLMHEGSVLFRTTYGRTLDTIGAGARVAFEVDGVEADGGWSVVVHGKAEEIWAPDEVAVAAGLPIRPSAPGDRNHFVRILPAAITGRRIAS